MTELHRVRAWADALITLHLDESWSFAFDHAKRRAGLCDYTSKRISVSRYLAARYDDDTNHQTLLHEVAHALAGAKAGHGPKWKAIARDLGYVGGTTHDGETATELAPWVGVCPSGTRRLPAPQAHATDVVREVRPPLRRALRLRLDAAGDHAGAAPGGSAARCPASAERPLRRR